MKMSVKDAAAALGASEAFVRRGLQQGRFPWGYAVRGKKRWSYFISEEMFEEERRCLKEQDSC